MEEWKIEIIKANNGYILTYMEDLGESTIRRIVFEEKENELEAMVDVLNFIQKFFGLGGSKHDKERIFVEINNKWRNKK